MVTRVRGRLGRCDVRRRGGGWGLLGTVSGSFPLFSMDAVLEGGGLEGGGAMADG